VKIPFVKAHGARNDFLLTWRSQIPELTDHEVRGIAIEICGRHTGIGADGWILLDLADAADAAIQLWNSDGSRSEISGNGTRCAAAHLVDTHKAGERVRVQTGAGVKHLRLMDRAGNKFSFEMNMGSARIDELKSSIVPGYESVILNVGNPQCAVFVEDFNFDWRSLGAMLERHSRFPDRTNVSFVHVVNESTLDVRFFERGAGETMSSGTGSTGAAAAAVSRGSARFPLTVETPAGPLSLRTEQQDIYLAGPAEIIGLGEYFYEE
jgi:diaminopimelate epimerase